MLTVFARRRWGIPTNVFRDFKPGRTEPSVVSLPPSHRPARPGTTSTTTATPSRRSWAGSLVCSSSKGSRTRCPRSFGRQAASARRAGVQIAGDEIVSDPTEIDPSKTTHRVVNGLVNRRFSLRRGESELWRLANIGTNPCSTSSACRDTASPSSPRTATPSSPARCAATTSSPRLRKAVRRRGPGRPARHLNTADHGGQPDHSSGAGGGDCRAPAQGRPSRQ